jgi:hypothetical protein
MLRELAKGTTPLNIFPLLFAAEHGSSKLRVVKEIFQSARKRIDVVSRVGSVFQGIWWNLWKVRMERKLNGP